MTPPESMTLQDAIERCKVRGYIAQRSNPHQRYYKNHFVSLINRVPKRTHGDTDWYHADPQDEESFALTA